MIKRCIFFIGLMYSTVFAQTFEYQWAQQMGGAAGSEQPMDMIMKNNYLYITGIYSNGCDFDPGVGTDIHAAQQGDIFILKKDTLGNQLTLVTLGGSEFDWGNAITVDDDGNIYVAGDFGGTVDFDPSASIYNLTALNQADAFVLKLDPTGNFIWAKQFSGHNYENGRNITLDGVGNVYISGTFYDTTDFDPGPGNYTLDGPGAFFVKLNPDGDFVWAKQVKMNTFGNVFANSLVLDHNNNIYSTGSFKNTVDFDTGPGNYSLTSFGGLDVYVLKLDSMGNLEWVDQFGDISEDRGMSLVIDDSANIYVTGRFRGAVDFDPGPSTFMLDSGKVFLMKLDSSNHFVWAKQFIIQTSAGGDAFPLSLFIDYSGNLINVGHFDFVASDFDPGPGTYILDPAGVYNGYICLFNRNGEFMSAAQFRSSPSCATNCESVVSDQHGGCFIAGNFSCITDLDPGPADVNFTAAGFADFFLLKLRHENLITPFSAENIDENKFILFPNPAENNFYIKLDKEYTNVQLQIFDLAGKLVLSTETKESDLISSQVNFVPGMYFVNIILGKERETLKLIIQ